MPLLIRVYTYLYIHLYIWAIRDMFEELRGAYSGVHALFDRVYLSLFDCGLIVGSFFTDTGASLIWGRRIILSRLMALRLCVYTVWDESLST